MTAVLFSKGWFPVGQLLRFCPLHKWKIQHAERQLIWIHRSFVITMMWRLQFKTTDFRVKLTFFSRFVLTLSPPLTDKVC